MKLIYKQNKSGFFCFIHHALHAVFKLAAVFCSGDKRTQVKRKNTFFHKPVRNGSPRNAGGKPFYNRGFSDTRFSYKHGIIFCPTRQNLNKPLNFFTASDNRIVFFFKRKAGQISRKFIKKRFLCRFSFINLRIFRGISHTE